MGHNNLLKPNTIKVTTILNFMMGLLGSLLATSFQNLVFDKINLLISISILGIITTIGFLIDAWLEHKNLRLPIKFILPIFVTGLIILALVTSVVSAILRPPTTYFLIDATEKMSSLFPSVNKVVGSAIIPSSKVGLRAYGGNISDDTGCGNTRQLIVPNLYNAPGEKLQSTLSLIQPRGHSSLVGAVLNAIDDLTNHEEPVKLIVITSGTDAICDSLVEDRSIIEGIAKNIKDNINIVIVSIGILDTQEGAELGNYALALHAGYSNISSPAQLPQVVQTVSGYGSKDYLYYRGTTTPTP